MERTEIVNAITESLREVLNNPALEVDEQVRLFDDLHLDSTSVLELLMALEDTVGLEIDPENLDMDDFQTVGSLADYVAANLGAMATAD